jgi:hypothetical protein
MNGLDAMFASKGALTLCKRASTDIFSSSVFKIIIFVSWSFMVTSPAVLLFPIIDYDSEHPINKNESGVRISNALAENPGLPL